MQFYDSISLRDAWWDTCCSKCGESIPDNPHRDVKITWSKIAKIAFMLWGPPDAFFVKDFLITMGFLKSRVLLVFCSKGPRRGEVDLCVPIEEESELKKAFMQEIVKAIEAQPDQEDYLDDEVWEGDYGEPRY